MVKLRAGDDAFWQAISATVAMTDEGLVAGDRCRLVRMRSAAGGWAELAIEADRDRLVALMSVARNQPVCAEDLVPHVEAAAGHWRGGDKALANLRLVFSPFAKVLDLNAVYRLSLAERLLDAGWAPNVLLAELGLASPVTKYDRDEPRLPAGTRGGGEWTFGPSTTSLGRDGRLDVAMEPGHPGGDDEKSYELRNLEGVETPADDLAHGRPIHLPSGGGIGPGPFAGRSIPAGPSKKPSASQQQQINEIGRDTGCHTCGATSSGLASGAFICDHQPPTALRTEETPQRYFPHCNFCRLRQGGLVSAIKRRSKAGKR